VVGVSREVVVDGEGITWRRAALEVGPLAVAFAGCETVVHLAAQAHDLSPQVRADAGLFDRINHLGTVAALEAAARAGARRFVLLSSIKAVCDTAPKPIDEDTPTAPADAYGASKRAAELAAAEGAARFGLELVVLRPPLVYGPGNRGNMARIIGAVQRGWPLPLGVLGARRSLIFVDNLCTAVVVAVAQRDLASATYFVADDLPPTVAELARTVGRVIGRPARIVAVPEPLLVALARAGDLVSALVGRSVGIDSYTLDRLRSPLVIDDARFRAASGWRPTVGFEDALRLTLAAPGGR